jgi:hypothetical protein
MVWTATMVDDLILVAKDVGVKLADSICRKMDLGQSTDKDVDMLFLICNVIFSLEYGTTDTHEDADYSYLAEIVDRIDKQRNRYRGL